MIGTGHQISSAFGLRRLESRHFGGWFHDTPGIAKVFFTPRRQLTGDPGPEPRLLVTNGRPMGSTRTHR